MIPVHSNPPPTVPCVVPPQNVVRRSFANILLFSYYIKKGNLFYDTVPDIKAFMSANMVPTGGKVG